MQRAFATIATILIFTLLAGCTDDSDFTAPAFLHMDGIGLAATSESGIGHNDPGFFTSNIVAAYMVAHYPGSMKEDSIGLFRMPFTIPVLHNGEVDYFDIYPAVEHSGQSLALPFYTFYNKIRISGDTLVSGDTLDLGMLTTTYNQQTDIPMLYEPFEPTEADVAVDSNMEWVRHDREGACVGEGYGRITVQPGVANVAVAIERTFVLTDPSKVCYLELDIKSTIETAVYMHAAYTSGGSEDKNSVMTIYPQDDWQHLYINLGRTWAYFNHPSTFRLSFEALNVDNTDGEVLIDNIKVLSTSVVL